MKRVNLVSAVAIATTGLLGMQAKAAILYQSLGTPAAVSAFFGSESTGTAGAGKGDDYTTTSPGSPVSLTGLTFYGGTSTALADIAINFYSTAGVLQATILPSAVEVLGNSAYHTLLSTDFGSGITVPGSGFIIFTPYATAGDGSAQAGFLGYDSTAPTIGTNNAAAGGAELSNASGVLSATDVFGFGRANVAKFELDGSPVPEPTSLALIAPAAILLGRRKRAR